MAKTFVLDTCVLLHNPESLFEFEDNDIVVPLVVLEELDEKNKDKSNGELAYSARIALRYIKDLRATGSLSKGVSLGEGRGIFKIDARDCPIAGLSAKKNDNIIMGCALDMSKQLISEVVLVTRDTALLLKADALGVTAEEYIGEAKNVSTQIGIVQDLIIGQETLDVIYTTKGIGCGTAIQVDTGQCVLMRVEGTKSSILARRVGDDLKIIDGKLQLSGIKHKNYEQSCLMDALYDPKIKMVVCAGQAGSGKTLLSMAAGMQLHKEGKFDKVLITKSIEPVGADIGYVKGSKKEKMAEWTKPFYDNLELLVKTKPKNAQEESDLDEMLDNILEVDAITYIRGRSLMHRFVIVDEVQNLRPKIIKTIVSRIHDSAKLILLGDLQQIDSPYLDMRNNGLTHAMNRLAGEDDVAILNLTKTERGRLASLAVEKL